MSKRRITIYSSVENFEEDHNIIAKGDILGKNIENRSKTEPNDIEHQIHNKFHIPEFLNTENQKFIQSETLIFARKKKTIKYQSILKILKIFEIIINVIIIYSVCESLNDLSFQSNFSGKEELSEAIWVLFIIDFITNFFVKKSHTKKIHDSIHFHYLKTWAIPDFISIVPLRYAGKRNEESICKLLRLFKINRLVNMINITKLSRYCIKKIKKSDKRYPEIEAFFALVWELLIIIGNMLIIIFALACLWWYYTYMFVRYEYVSANYFDTYFSTKKDTLEEVIITIYFIATTLLTVGYGDYSATNSGEMVLCIFLVAFGAIVFAYTMAIAGFYISSLSKLLKSNRNLIKLKKIFGKLAFKRGLMPVDLKNKILAHFQFYWKNDILGCLAKGTTKTNDVKKLVKRHSSYFKDIPIHLKKHILEDLCNDIFRRFRFLFPEDNDFRYHICTFLQPQSYSKGTILMEEGKDSEEIIIVIEGNVSMCFTDIGEVLVSCKTFSGWFVLGDYCVVMNKPSFATFIVTSDLKAYSIPKEAFRLIGTSLYHKFFLNLQTIVTRRASKLISLMGSYGYESYQDVLDELYRNEKRSHVVSVVDKVTLRSVYELSLVYYERYLEWEEYQNPNN